MKRILMFLALAAGSAAAADITVEAPLGGWHNSAGEEQAFMQSVQYPAVRVNVRNARARASLIKGQIARAPKDKTPLTLIVNGTPMPMRAEGGQFGRPYAFPSGSNSVEVRSSDGSRRRVQSFEAYSGRVRSHVRVTLSWDSDGTDLDLHLITPAGEHVFYGNRAAHDGTALDLDVTTGYGPEIISGPSQQHGTYLIYVNYYGNGNAYRDEDSKDEAEILTVAQVAIVTDEGTPKEKQQVFRIPMRAPGELTLVKAFHYP